LSLISVARDREDLDVSAVSSNFAPTYMLTGVGADHLESGTGARFDIDSDSVVGYVDAVTEADGQLAISGWAVDTSSKKAVEAVAVFIDDRFAASVVPSLERPDLSEGMGIAGTLNIGFALQVSEPTSGYDPERVRVFGVSSVGASELTVVESISDQFGAGASG
jgi:hypothetical protein